MDKIVEVKNLKTYFYNPSLHGFTRALDGIDFEAKSREILGIMGESGSGKSSLAHSILGIASTPPGVISGEIWFDDGFGKCDLLEPLSKSCSVSFDAKGNLTVKKDLRKWRSHERIMKKVRGRKIALIPQGTRAALSPYLKVEEQVYQAYVRGDKSESEGETCRISAQKNVDEIISLLGLRKVKKEYLHSLSGGECQRLAIGLAVALNPTLLIADEPTTGLDITLQAQIADLLEGFVSGYTDFTAEKSRRGLIVISHNPKLIDRLAHRVILMRSGKIVGEIDKSHNQSRVGSLMGSELWRSSPKVSSDEPIVKVDDIGFKYPLRFSQKLFNPKVESRFGLRSVSFEMHNGEILGIIGESGCGKTTLGKAVSALLPNIDSGAILYHQKDIYSPAYDRVKYRKKVQMIFQNPESTLNPRLRVNESLIEAANVGSKEKLRRSELNVLASDYLRKVQLEDKSDKLISHLSGGERRRLGVARALAVSPELIVADEVFSGIDAKLKFQLAQLLLSERNKKSLSYIFILHELQLVEQLCETVAVLYKGRLVEWGKILEVFNPDSAKHPYTSTLLKASESFEIPPDTDIFADGDRSEVGCDFRHRCPIYKKLGLTQRRRCQSETPSLKNVGKEHKISCHFLG